MDYVVFLVFALVCASVLGMLLGTVVFVGLPFLSAIFL